MMSVTSHMPHAVPYPSDVLAPNTPTLTPAALCTCCLTAKRSANAATCSKRCEWFLAGRCPQCGRGRRSESSTGPFCSNLCASHSVHANWCPTCTIRQSTAGRQHCSESCAHASEHGVIPSPPRRRADTAAHVMLARSDREHMTVANMFKGLNVIGVVRVAPQPLRRRQYLNLRAAVEQRMTANRSTKYGFGGEGNEHKRYCPVMLRCSLRTTSTGAVTPCADPSCEACALLLGGFSTARTGMASHYCMATAEVAASWATPSQADGISVVAVVRAITGNAQILSSPDEIREPWLEGYDSCVVTDGDATYEGTYVFSDDAIEALYLVLLM